jgi:hypothetical protein
MAEHGDRVRRVPNVFDGDRLLCARHERHDLHRQQWLHGRRHLPERRLHAWPGHDLHGTGVQGRGDVQSGDRSLLDAYQCDEWNVMLGQRCLHAARFLPRRGVHRDANILQLATGLQVEHDVFGGEL